MLNEIKITHIIRQLRVFEALAMQKFNSKAAWLRSFEMLSIKKHSDFEDNDIDDDFRTIPVKGRKSNYRDKTQSRVSEALGQSCDDM